MADEVEVRLSRMRRAMAKMAAEGREAEFAALDAAYEALTRKRDEDEAARLREERVRVRREAAVRPSERSGRWRLPRGFASPLAAERARSGWRPREEPSMLAGGLRPWRRYGGPMSDVIWRP